MSYRDLNAFGKIRSTEFAHTAATYANYLWTEKFYARAILALNRSLYSESNDPHLHQLYAAYEWFLQNYPGDKFLGNPRISYLHQATRMRAENAKYNSQRAWALWYLTRKTRPDLPADPKETENPPNIEQLTQYLNKSPRPKEGTAWLKVLES